MAWASEYGAVPQSRIVFLGPMVRRIGSLGGGVEINAADEPTLLCSSRLISFAPTSTERPE
jgi:hypothetical protein